MRSRAGLGCRRGYRHRSTTAAESEPRPPRALVRRRGLVGACSEAELVTHIEAENEASPFHGEGYRKILVRLRHRGVLTAARRVRRLMKDHGLQTPHRVRPFRQMANDGTIITKGVDEVWGTDMTQTVTTSEGRAYVFVAVDHCSGETVGCLRSVPRHAGWG